MSTNHSPSHRTVRTAGRRRSIGGVIAATIAVATLVAGLLTAPPAGAAITPSTPVPTLSVGDFHACAIVGDGSTRCWGSNSRGQLTVSGGSPGATTAVAIDGYDGAVEVAAGGLSTCGRSSNGTVRCWGANGSGQLGDGTTTDRTRPVFVRNTDNTPLTGVVRLAAGFNHACALLSAGTVRCWGLNFAGQLGDGTTTSRSRPVFVRNTDNTPLSGVTQIVAGAISTCARLTTGQVRCWGDNSAGQLGDGTTTNRSRPVFVRNADNSPLAGVGQVAAGGVTTCARMTNGQARCWGSNGGRIGDGTTTNRTRPVFVRNADGTPFSGVAQIATGVSQTCARLVSGQVRCWGSNAFGNLGDGAGPSDQLTPVTVRIPGGAALSGATQISSGFFHTCVRLTNGQARCWGYNDVGEIGDGSTTNRNLAQQVLTSGALAGIG